MEHWELNPDPFTSTLAPLLSVLLPLLAVLLLNQLRGWAPLKTYTSGIVGGILGCVAHERSEHQARYTESVTRMLAAPACAQCRCSQSGQEVDYGNGVNLQANGAQVARLGHCCSADHVSEALAAGSSATACFTLKQKSFITHRLAPAITTAKTG